MDWMIDQHLIYSQKRLIQNSPVFIKNRAKHTNILSGQFAKGSVQARFKPGNIIYFLICSS